MSETGDEGRADSEGRKLKETTSLEKLMRHLEGMSDINKGLFHGDDVQMPYSIYTSLGERAVYLVDTDEFEELFGAHVTV